MNGHGSFGNYIFNYQEATRSLNSLYGGSSPISSNISQGFSTLSGGGITAVVEDSSPRLGGNLRTNSFHISLNTIIQPKSLVMPTVTGVWVIYTINLDLHSSNTQHQDIFTQKAKYGTIDSPLGKIY
jgi:hypothetical protein